MSAAMDASVFVLMLASWACCFWLGLQFGRGRSEFRYKQEVADLERRFKIVNCETVEAPEQKRNAA
ncbi:MAG: hypothetical protein WA652_04010 [Xanthobacteraceae bacterium]